MKLLAVSDCEAGLPALPAGTPELVVCCGDVPRDVLERVVARYGVPCLGVLGNHDPALPPAFMQEVHLKVVEFGGVTFGGFGGSWRYKPRGHHLFDDAQVEAFLRGFPRADVFVAHNPPAGVHDAPDDVHNGFAAFRRYIGEEQPALFLHGHVHRSAETMVGRTRVVAVSGARMVEHAEEVERASSPADGDGH